MENKNLDKILDSEVSMNVKKIWSIPTIVDLDVNLTESGTTDVYAIETAYAHVVS